MFAWEPTSDLGSFIQSSFESIIFFLYAFNIVVALLEGLYFDGDPRAEARQSCCLENHPPSAPRGRRLRQLRHYEADMQ